ncbi:MAG: hypothetical protein IPO49_15270 [Bacteroidetes bacterium]|nr:hypothetical protein [Bacteroidota bacterium]
MDGSSNAEEMMFDSTGNLLNTIGVQPWEFCHGFPEQITFDLFSTSYTSDSGYLYVGTTGYLNVSSFCHPTADLYVVKTNNLNDTAWTASLTIPDYQSVRNVVELSGRYFILFYDMNYLKSVVLDSDGSILMVDTIGVSAIIPTGTNSPYFADIIENGDATLTYIYSDYDTLISPTYERVFIKKDRYLSNTIKGNVYADLNNNCLKDSIDFNLQNILVVAEPGPYYGVTDFTGNYKINVDTGTYYINQVNNYQYFDTACNSGYSMTIFDSLNLVSDSINFVNQPSEYCSKYWVDCAIGSSRRCNNGSIAVRICNEGTVADSNLVLLITLNDNYAPGLNGSLSLLQQIGNSYKFQLPVILPGTCLNANFVGTIGCNARVFSSNCIRAEILHDEQCGQYDSAFDTRQVLILGRCINDTVEFVVKNNSVINESYGFYKIWQDGISIQLDTFRISPGDSIILLEFAGSSTIRLQLFFFNPATVTFFEGAQLSIEGCFSSASTGFVNQLPTNLYHDKFDEVCSVITGPIDPNDKSVLPVGIGFDHSVKKSDILTYKIRFQNVGNDTAFSVLIRDTISEDLDISSIYSGASSHEYEFNIYGDRIAEWFFPNINLPDSFINEQESNGFVDFDIRPRNTISAGSFIRNKAEIYFDFNEPVITNSTENKICDSLTSSFTF